MTTVIVNYNAEGIWSRRVGEELEYVGSGLNSYHCIVKVPGERRAFGFPAAWLDGLTPPAPVGQPRCELCGRVLP